MQAIHRTTLLLKVFPSVEAVPCPTWIPCWDPRC
jgi:hypothetical protein